MNINDYGALLSNLKQEQSNSIPQEEIEDKKKPLLEGVKDTLNVLSGGLAEDTLQDLIKDQLSKGKKVATEQIQRRLGDLKAKGEDAVAKARQEGQEKLQGLWQEAYGQAKGKSKQVKKSVKDIQKTLDNSIEDGKNRVSSAGKAAKQKLKNTVDDSIDDFRTKVNDSGLSTMKLDTGETFTYKGELPDVWSMSSTDPIKVGYDNPFTLNNFDKTFNSLRDKTADDVFSTPQTISQAQGSKGSLVSRLAEEEEQQNAREAALKEKFGLTKGQETAEKVSKDVDKEEEFGGEEVAEDPVGAIAEAGLAIVGSIASAFIKTDKQEVKPLPQVSNYSIAIGA